MRHIYIVAILAALAITAMIMYPQYVDMYNIQQLCKRVSTQNSPDSASTSNEHFWNKQFSTQIEQREENAYLRCVIKLTHNGIQ
ncbi:hypothetical protein [Shewanella sp. NKUCC06_TVS]|uniref:hypothetical protein n=1 Tax=Shewanella sp. NKUCC06_TVS TaxID=2842128 RepID=UPI001C5AE1F0|nr:hypothetical protein [Shewanella sp. NKUCC06_TVS]MBW3533434.1 hypothetical protein [Shewanella sp. NKUCC06_TVS]